MYNLPPSRHFWLVECKLSPDNRLIFHCKHFSHHFDFIVIIPVDQGPKAQPREIPEPTTKSHRSMSMRHTVANWLLRHSANPSDQIASRGGSYIEEGKKKKW